MSTFGARIDAAKNVHLIVAGLTDDKQITIYLFGVDADITLSLAQARDLAAQLAEILNMEVFDK